MPICVSRFICLRRGAECICLSGRTTAAGWQRRLIAMQRDGWEVVELEDGAVLEVNAADWLGPYSCAVRLERNRQLRNWAVTDFIRSMEQRRYLNGRWVSVFSLMRDGEALSAQLRKALEGKLNIREIVRPYIQVVTPESVCERTGFD